jgi:3-oxoacyl-[acyl-carrier-protein] synthase-3
MTAISLVGSASYLPETVRDNAFFGAEDSKSPMFRGSRHRRHVAPGETAAGMIEMATRKLSGKLGLQLDRDVDILLTNVPFHDVPFGGSGASVARLLGLKPQWIIDMQNTGCVSFVFMLELARALMGSSPAKTALLCNVQNTAGRIFALPGNRERPQSAIPGDGCGVSYVVANAESPVRAIYTRSYGEYANDMRVKSDDGRPWWEPGEKPFYLDFAESRVARIVLRGNRLVPEALREACRAAEVAPKDLDVLITNQPNAFFLRNWREALELPEHKHVHTFDEHGNLFGAGMPICIEKAIDAGLRDGALMAVGGFSHAGDYAGAAVIEWRRRSSS